MPDSGVVSRYCNISYIPQINQDNSFDINIDPKFLSEFSLKDKIYNNKLSGGESTRVKLVSAFSENAKLLFADEPTTHLDSNGINLFKQKLSNYESFLIISHDIDLIDSFCNQIWEIENGNINIYSGNYQNYKLEKQILLQEQSQKYDHYIKEKRRLEQTLENKYIKSANKRKNKKINLRYHPLKLEHSQKKSDSSIKQIKTKLDSLEHIDKPIQQNKIYMDYSITNPPKNKIVISANSFNFSYGNNIIFKDATFEVKNKSKVAVTGSNGSGKTTLFNSIYSGNPQINTVPKAKIGYFMQDLSNLDYDKNILENIIETSIQNQSYIRTALSILGFCGDDVFKKVSVLSGGECVKISLAKILLSDTNILMLDEITNFLDINSIEAVTELLQKYEGTIIFISHDKKFIKSIATSVIEIKDKRIISLDNHNTQATKKDKTNRESKQNNRKFILELKLNELEFQLSKTKSKPQREILLTEYNNIISEYNSLF